MVRMTLEALYIKDRFFIRRWLKIPGLTKVRVLSSPACVPYHSLKIAVHPGVFFCPWVKVSVAGVGDRGLTQYHYVWYVHVPVPTRKCRHGPRTST